MIKFSFSVTVKKIGHTVLSLLEDLGILQRCSLEEIFL